MDRLCQAPEVEYVVLLLQFAGGVIVTLEEAQDVNVTQGMVGDRKVLLFVAYRAQMLYKIVSESTLGLTNVEEATLGAVDAVDRVDGCAIEPISDME
eukprot:g19925.t1